MKINGENVPYFEKMNVESLLLSCGLDPSRVAVERNGQIVPREAFARQALSAADVLELVQFVGGG